MPTSEPWAILKQVLLLLACFFGLYGTAIAVSYLLFPLPNATAPIDTLKVDETIYMTAAKEIYYDRRSLRLPGKKVILIGSSNMAVGVRQPKLQAVLPDFMVHNMSIGDNNITEARQVLALDLAVMREADVKNSVFVIGIWYGMFVDNSSRWNVASGESFETDIDRERFRYGFWKRTNDGPLQLISDSNTDRAALFIHPMMALEKAARLTTAGLRSHIFVRPPVFDDEARDSTVMTPEQRANHMSFRRTFMKKPALGEEQYRELGKFVHEVTARGAKVIVVDLPIPDWHKKALPYDFQHSQHMKAFIRKNAAVSGFSYLDLRGLDDDASFYDDAHLRPRAQGPWLEALQDRIRLVAPHLATKQ